MWLGRRGESRYGVLDGGCLQECTLALRGFTLDKQLQCINRCLSSTFFLLPFSLIFSRTRTHTQTYRRALIPSLSHALYTRKHMETEHTHTHVNTHTRISQTSTPINLAATQTNKQTNNPPTDLTTTIYRPAGRSWSWGRNYLADNKGKTVKRRLTVIADVITYFLSIKHGAGGPRSQLRVGMSDRNSSRWTTQR